MKTNTKRSRQASTPPTVTEPIKLKVGSKTIQITATDKKISAHAGQEAFADFLSQHGVREMVAGVLPQRPRSPNALAPVEIALGFITAVLAEADKLTRVAWLRGDPVLPQIFNLKRLPSQSTLSRFLRALAPWAASSRSGAVHWNGYPGGVKATRWISTQPPCCTKTALRRECGWATPAWASSPACIRF